MNEATAATDLSQAETDNSAALAAAAKVLPNSLLQLPVVAYLIPVLAQCHTSGRQSKSGSGMVSRRRSCISEQSWIRLPLLAFASSTRSVQGLTAQNYADQRDDGALKHGQCGAGIGRSRTKPGTCAVLVTPRLSAFCQTSRIFQNCAPSLLQESRADLLACASIIRRGAICKSP